MGHIVKKGNHSHNSFHTPHMVIYLKLFLKLIMMTTMIIIAATAITSINQYGKYFILESASSTHSLSHSPLSLTLFLTRSFACWLTHSLIHSLTHPPTHQPTHQQGKQGKPGKARENANIVKLYYKHREVEIFDNFN